MYLRVTIICIILTGLIGNSAQSCTEWFNSEQCYIKISCNGGFSPRSSSNYKMNNGFTSNVLCETIKLEEYDYYRGRRVFEYYTIHLLLHDDSIIYDDTTKQIIPALISDHTDNNIMKLITFIDIRNNTYTVMPILNDMKNLVVIDLSYNNMNVARLTNKYDLPALSEIDLSHNNINEIVNNQNEYAFTKLTKVNLSHNQLTIIPEGVFEPCKELEILDLSHNFIDTLNLKTFEGPKKLKNLNFSFNKISAVNFSLFRFSELKVLDLSFNQLTYIKTSDFDGLTKIEILDLSNNFITNVEKDTFGHMVVLKSLYINNNNLINLDKNMFKNASFLTNIDMSQNHLKTIPKEIFNGKEIQNFSVKDNQLEGAIDKNMFDGLTFVQNLNLSYQSLESVGDYAFFGLNNIEVILLNNNNIKDLSPKSFRMVQTLKKLDLSFNKIRNLDFEKSDLYNLSSLYLRNNNITVIKQVNFNGLNGLQFLDISDNKISHFESNSFLSLRELINLEISRNPLTGVIKENTFDGLNSLPSLDISCTSLMSIQNSSFNGMVQLKNLNISHGKINVIEYNIFINTGNIEIVDLSYNSLEEFSINSTELGKMEILYLNNNYIKTLNSNTFKLLLRLMVFSLSHNLVENIVSDTFSNQKYLRDVDLSYNPLNVTSLLLNEIKIVDNLNLSGIKRGLMSFDNVEDASVTQLKISNSSVTDAKKLHMSKLHRLDSLILSNNDISKLDNEGFSNLNALRILDLSHNKIAYIQPGAFKDNTLLFTLNVSHNFLSDITYGIFHGLTYLHTLDISFNNIHDLDNERFHEAIGLSVIIADNNKIESISSEEFLDMHLERLSIGDNPIPCDILVNLKRGVSFHVTARRLDFTNNDNVHGVSCAKISNLPNIVTNDSFPSTADSTKVLLNIRDILMNRFDKNEVPNIGEGEKHVLDNINNNIEKLNTANTNLNDKLTQIMNSTIQNNNKPEFNDDTTALLQKILKALTISSVRQAPTLEVNSNATNVNIVTYVNKIKQELEANIAFEKDLLESKISAVSALYNAKHTTHDDAKHEKQISNDSKSYFTETCIGLILLTLVCYVFFVVYKSGIFVRKTFTMSTRELPGATDSSL